MGDSPISLAVYVTWQSLFGKPSTISDLRSELSRLPLIQALRACALVNASLRGWEGDIDVDQHEQLLRRLFTRQFADHLNNLARKGVPRRFVFHRLQQLFLIKEAFGCCKDVDEQLPEFNEVFAKSCLRANDLLHYGLAFDPTRLRVERLLPEMVTVNDYAGRESILHKAARTRILLDEILDTETVKQRKEFIDIRQLFADASGMDVRQYSNLVLAVLARFQKLTLEDYLRSPDNILLTGANFGNAKMSSAARKRFWEVSSAPLNHYRKSLPAQNPTDFTVIRDRPLAVLNDETRVPLDIGFLADKLENGVFWTVERHALNTKVQRDNHHALWGHMFEVYVSQLLSETCKTPENAFHPNPEFRQGDELCDGLVVCGTSGVFMEYKASMITAEAKYSGSPEKFLEELKRKFVGVPEKPKGIGQLANSISKIGRRGKQHPVIGVKRLLKIFPVLIAKDSALASPMVNRFLNEVFRNLYDRKKIRPVITPLFVLSIDELERLSPYLNDKPLSEILEAKYERDPSQSWPFSAIPNEVLQGEPTRTNETLEKKFETIANQACLDLFGESLKGGDDQQ